MNVRLSRWLVLEERRQVPDGSGGFRETWAALGSLWADVRSQNGRNGGDDLIALSAVGYRILVRGAPMGAPSRPKAGQRFRDGERLFDILAVTEHDPEGHYLSCTAREEVLL